MRRGALLILLAAVAAALAAAGLSSRAAAAGPAFRLVRIATVHEPVFVAQPPGDSRLFVVQKDGLIRIYSGGHLLSRPFADLRADVRDGGEQGLLSVAFDPAYARTGYLYVDFTDRNGDTRVWRLHARRGAAAVDPGHREILFVHQPYPNHNGGQLEFGPDGDLYVGMGDGGSEDDPNQYGQSLHTDLAKLLRLDVRGSAGPTRFSVPPSNPFLGQAGVPPEIYSYGLRNPWRFSFDRATGTLYIGDVGQDRWEEIDALSPAGARGANFGWNAYEARFPFHGGAQLERAGHLVFPVAWYSHANGCSVTGGYVYRGTAIPSLRGVYLYSDYCSSFLRGFRLQGGRAVDQKDYSPVMRALGITEVVSFGRDQRGELYVCSLVGGVYELVPG